MWQILFIFEITTDYWVSTATDSDLQSEAAIPIPAKRIPSRYKVQAGLRDVIRSSRIYSPLRER